MRIIHAHKYFYDRAGAERYMLDVMRLQEEHGHAVAPFSMHHPKNQPSAWSEYFVSELNTEGVGRGLGALRQFRRAWWSREAELKMAKMIDAFQPDVVHVHNIYTHLSPSILRACRRHNVPVVMSVHDYSLVSANYSLWNAKDEAPMNLERLGLLATARTRFIKGSYLATLARASVQRWHKWRGSYDKAIDRYLPVSEFVRVVMVKSGYRASKMTVLHPFTQSPSVTKKKHGGPVVFVGRLESYKGLGVLIEAMRSFPHVKLQIAGTGPDENRFREQASDMKNVEFLGFVRGEAKDALFARARVVVAPSIWHEPLGLVAYEALLHGTPAIVSDRGGMQEVIEAGVSGEVCKGGDVDSLLQKLNSFLHDGTHATSFAESAVERARSFGSPEDHYERLTDIYEDVISTADETRPG